MAVTVRLEQARPVEEDARTVMRWRNDPVTRKMSFDSLPKQWPDFFEEYRTTYFDMPELPPLFGLYEGRRVAFIRFRPYFNDALPQPSVDIGINIDPAERGKGFSVPAIESATRLAFAEGAASVVAEIFEENEASLRAFVRAGYEPLIVEPPHDGINLARRKIRRMIARRPQTSAEDELPCQHWVFFDMDGVLADSLGLLFDSYALFMRLAGIEPTREEFEELNGPSFVEIVATLQARYNLAERLEGLQQHYFQFILDAYANDVQPGAGAESLLRGLASRGVRMALVTSSHESLAGLFLDRLQWRSLFSACAFGNEVERGKPAPDIYQLALERTKAKADAVWVVEDSVNGVRAARAAGLQVAGLAATPPQETLLLNEGAAIVSRRLDALEHVLAKSPRGK